METYCFQSNNITHLSKEAFGKLPVVFELILHDNQIHNIRFELYTIIIFFI